jgi:hypothetical protein
MCMSCDDGDFLSHFKIADNLPETPEVGADPDNGRYKHPVVEGESPQARKKRLAAESQSRRYEERKAKGLCPNCGRDRENPDQWLCNHCHSTRKKHNSSKTDYDQRKADGVCVRCGKAPAADKRSMCEGCGEKQRIRKRLTTEERKPKRVGKTQQERLAAAKADGRCSSCQKRPATEGKATCGVCRERIKQTYAARKAEGKCTACGEPAVSGKLNCQECLDKHRERGNARTTQLKQEAFTAYGGAFCACCGEDHPLFLQLDHIHNDGAQKRKAGEDGLGATLYAQLKNRGWPPGYQVLCAGCNWAKDKNNGVCPHQTENRNVNVSEDYHPIDLSEWS